MSLVSAILQTWNQERRSSGRLEKTA